MNGQMCEREHVLIYDTIVRLKPLVVLECGTWFGGGSTQFAAKALRDNDRGVLHTFETDDEVLDEAVQSFEKERPDLRKRIVFHHRDFLKAELVVLGPAQVAILDGPDDADFCFDAFKLIDRYGAVAVLVHDFDRHKGEGVMAAMGKSKRHWHIEKRLETPTGMALITTVDA